MQLIDWLTSHVKIEDINKDKFGLELKNENEIKEWGNDMEIRYKKSGGDLNSKALEACSKRLKVPIEYINNRVLCESINYFIDQGDTDKADALFAKAIGNGCAEAIYLLALYHTQCGGNISDSLQFYEQISQLPPTIKLIDSDDQTIPNNKVSESMYMTGSFNLNSIGCEQNLSKAFEYYNKGAELNNEKCLRDLGLIYIKGIDKLVEKDIEKALDLFKKASDLGDAVSKFNYGMLLFNDNPSLGFQYLKESADLGFEEAINYLSTAENIINGNKLVEEELIEQDKKLKKKKKSNNNNGNKIVEVEDDEENKEQEQVEVLTKKVENIVLKEEEKPKAATTKKDTPTPPKIVNKGNDCDEVD